jgi:hypothetical protein
MEEMAAQGMGGVEIMNAWTGSASPGIRLTILIEKRNLLEEYTYG